MTVNRIEKVNSLLLQEIGKIVLQDFDFPGTLVTLTRVQATSNLIEAKVFISSFPEKNTDKIADILNKNISDIQKQINRKLNMRPVPKIRFVKDTNPQKVGRIEELLQSLKKDEK